jgi:hypothetical protein
MLPISVRVSAHIFAGVLRSTSNFWVKSHTTIFSATLIGSITRGMGYTVHHVSLQACIGYEAAKTLIQRIVQRRLLIDSSDQYLNQLVYGV